MPSAVRMAPLSWNVLIGATDLTDVEATYKGCPLANLVDQDMTRPAQFRERYRIGATSQDRVDFNEGAGSFVGQLTNSTTFYGPGDQAEDLAAAMNGAGGGASTDYSAYKDLITHKWAIAKTSGTFELENATGTNVARAWCNVHGWSAQDTGLAASHTADYVSRGETFRLEWNLLTAKPIRCAAFIGANFGPAVERLRVRWAEDAAFSVGTDFANVDNYDDELMAVFFSAVVKQYVRLAFVNPRMTHAEPLQMSYFYVGDYFQMGVNWEVGTYRRGISPRAVAERSAAGYPVITERKPGRPFTLAWNNSPGIDPEDLPAVRAFLGALGLNDLLLVWADPDTEPNREGMLCRVTSPPEPDRWLAQSPRGRYSLGLQLERVESR